MTLALETPEGHVYYIRLSHPKGIFYKLGFTKANDVATRFSYQGSQNYKLIDKVLIFKYSPFAYDIEQICHRHLRPYQAYKGYGFKYLFSDMSKHPLFQDGQSEIYKDDVLGLDPDFKPVKSFLGMGKKNGYNVVFGNGLDFSYIHESGILESKKFTYKVLQAFISQPLQYNRSDFIAEHAEWVVNLNKWSSLNAAASLSERTIHNATPMPITREGWLSLRVFSPVWQWAKNPPKELGYLEKLEKIILSSSEVDELPESIYKLKELKVLDIAMTSIASLSSKIKNLMRLEVLNLGFCERLTSLPIEVFELPHLTIYAKEPLASTLRQMAPEDSKVIISTEYFCSPEKNY